LFDCVQAAFQAVVKQYIEHEIVQVLSLEQVAAKSFGKAGTKAAIEWAQTSGTVPGTWKLSSDGWMRELKLSAEEPLSFRPETKLQTYAGEVWNNTRRPVKRKLKKQQERAQRKRPAEGQPGGAPAAKCDKQTR
jgi:hypothetical protein